jgi:hypothetical protein
MKVAVGLAFLLLLVPAASASSTRPRTILTTRGSLVGFAQDGSRLAVATVGGGQRCGIAVRVHDLRNGRERLLTTRRGPTCGLYAEPGGDGFDLVYRGGTAIWELQYGAHFNYQDVYESSLARPRDRFVEELVYDNDSYFTGEHVTPLAGGATAFYGWYTQSVQGSDDCDLELTCTVVVTRGGIHRVDARGRVTALAGAPPTAALAVADGRVALVRATPDVVWYAPPGMTSTVEVRNAGTGKLVTSFDLQGRVRALALSRGTLAVLVSDGGAARIDRYDPTTGVPVGSTPVPAAKEHDLSIAGHRVAFRVGARIELLDTANGSVRTIARTRGDVIGLSIQGRRIAWGQNAGTHGVVRAVVVS